MHFLFGNLTNFHPASCCFSRKSIFVCLGVYDWQTRSPFKICNYEQIQSSAGQFQCVPCGLCSSYQRCLLFLFLLQLWRSIFFLWTELNCVGETFVTLQAMLQSHDEVLKISTGEEVNQYHADTSTGYNGRMEESMSERPEKLTRVRLVQFHKNLNEPMVRMQVHALRPYR